MSHTVILMNGLEKVFS